MRQRRQILADLRQAMANRHIARRREAQREEGRLGGGRAAQSALARVEGARAWEQDLQASEMKQMGEAGWTCGDGGEAAGGERDEQESRGGGIVDGPRRSSERCRGFGGLLSEDPWSKTVIQLL